MPDLFSPFTLKDVTLRNRIAMSPMTMYRSPPNGTMTDYHLMLLGSRAAGGFGLVFHEQLAITPDGRTTTSCAGIYDDAQIEGLARVNAMIRDMGGVPAIQLGHTGRKGSETKPWEGGLQLPPDHPDGWQVRAVRHSVWRREVPLSGAGADGGGDPRPTWGLCGCGAAGRGGRLRVAGDALCARLPRRELLLADRQPQDRPVRRLAGEPVSLPPRGSRCRARGIAGEVPANSAARLG